MLASIFHTSPIAITVTNQDTGAFVDLNPAAEQLFGYRRDEIIGSATISLEQLLSPQDRAQLAPQLAAHTQITAHPATIIACDGTASACLLYREPLELEGQCYDLSYLVDVSLGPPPIPAAPDHSAVIDRLQRAEAALRASEARFKGLLEATPDALVIVSQDGTILLVNAQAAHFFGYAQADLVGMPVDMLLPSRFQHRHMSQRADFAAAPRQRMMAPQTDLFARRKDGSECQVEISLSHHRIDGELIIISAIRDLTPRLEAEEQLRQHEANYRYLFEHNPHPMWAFDEQSLRFLAVNDAAIQVYGYSRDEFLGMTILEIRPDEDRAPLIEHIAKPRPALSAAGFWRHQRKDGSVIDVEITSHAMDLFGRRARLVVAQDVTARLAAEAALRQSEARFATIFARSPIALSISRLSDGIITHVNDAFLALCGRTHVETQGRTKLDLALWARPADRQHVLEQLRAQQRVSSFEAVIRSASGAEHQVLLSGELVMISAEPHLLLQFMDISALKQAQQELQALNHTLELRVEQRTAEVRDLFEMLRQANAELMRAARAKDEFLANMSHELRTPINAILGYSENFQEQIYGPLSERQQRAIGTIESSGRHLLTLINDILDLAKVEAGRLELQIGPLFVEDVCQASLLFVREQALKKRLQLHFQVDHPHTVIEADLTRLKQMLVNLLSNAVKFTPEGGAVGLEVMADAEDGVTRFTVHDTGIGIAPADLGRLFQPFSQIDSQLSRAVEGTGLGLALVRRLAEAHGGSVTVESTLGQGSRFTVALPYHHLAAGPAAGAPALVPGTAETTSDRGGATLGRILLADDNEANISAVREYLHARGYAVSIAHDGYEALAIVDEVQPDLILMDIQMPRLDGLATIRRLRSLPAYAATPIIALTALAMPGDEQRCLEAGASAYLAKPVSMRALVGAVQRLVEHV